MRKTKIICTLGPATEKEDLLKQLITNGMNVARLNFSHGTHEGHKKTVKKFKKIRDELNLPIGLLLDTKGPEIRIKKFEKGSADLEKGKIFTLTSDDVTGNDEIVSVTYKDLAKDVSSGDRILLDDGLIELKVINKIKDGARCEIINGGTVSNNKGVNVPNIIINMPFVSEKDKNDLLFAIENKFDYIAASFVQNSNGIKELKKILEDNNGTGIKIIAKIENREGVNNIDDIIRVADGVMIARGDMGVEIPFEELPSVQKIIIKKCNLAGKPVITATQMLDSMIKNPRPTRAEITDVANAIYDGTCAIMLSGETSIGKYPLEAMLTMSKIAIHTEGDIDYVKRLNNIKDTGSRNVTKAISRATCETAHMLGAAAIISVTKSGHSAQMVSRYRPACPVIATTISREALWQLSLLWGVEPVLTEYKSNTDEIFKVAIEKAAETGLVKNGDLAVITGGMPAGISGTTNTIKVQIIGDVLIRANGINKLTAQGNLCVVDEMNDALVDFNAGDILVISRTTGEVLQAIKNAAALITEEDSEDFMAAIAGQAIDIPVLTNAKEAAAILKSGTVATVDASKGFVYSGIKKDLPAE